MARECLLVGLVTEAVKESQLIQTAVPPRGCSDVWRAGCFFPSPFFLDRSEVFFMGDEMISGTHGPASKGPPLQMVPPGADQTGGMLLRPHHPLSPNPKNPTPRPIPPCRGSEVIPHGGPTAVETGGLTRCSGATDQSLHAHIFSKKHFSWLRSTSVLPPIWVSERCSLCSLYFCSFALCRRSSSLSAGRVCQVFSE